MKFEIFQDKKKEWRWNAQAGGSIIFSSGEGFEKPQKAVQTLRKNVVRDDVKLEEALVKALKKAGLDEKGGLRGLVCPSRRNNPAIQHSSGTGQSASVPCHRRSRPY